MIALYEPAGAAFPAVPAFSRPLNNPYVWELVSDAAAKSGTTHADKSSSRCLPYHRKVSSAQSPKVRGSNRVSRRRLRGRRPG